jgi:hypothetical protein
MKGLWRHLKEGESGVVIVQLALMAVLVMLMAAFAVDLGWFFLNASRIQRSADASALGGVVYMPDQQAIGVDRAERVAAANGYVDGDDGATLTIVPQPDGKANQLEVTISDEVPTFFLRVLGQSTQTISRTGRAEYLRPLPMGSPEGQFGNDGQDGLDPSCVDDPCFWANIHGTFTNTGMGDAFSSFCRYGTGWGGSNNSNCPESNDHRGERGYLYSVGHTGGAFSVQVQNINFERGGSEDQFEWCTEVCVKGPTTRVRVYRPDPTPLSLEPTGLVCERTYDPVDAPSGYQWVEVCSILAPEAGAYTVEVKIVDDPDTLVDDAGLNRYSIRATGGTTISALGDMAIWTDFSGDTTFFLARVAPSYAGRTLVVELYDPGDTGGEESQVNEIFLVDPGSDSLKGAWAGGCRISIRRNGQTDFGPAATTPAGTQCSIDATRPVNDYDGDWLRMEVDLPESYTCTDCWWKIRYEYNGSVSDTTTWRAFISGSPLRLVLGG